MASREVVLQFSLGFLLKDPQFLALAKVASVVFIAQNW